MLVGMDFDHFYKKQDPGLEYVLGNPRRDVLICEGSEGHVVKELTAGTCCGQVSRPPHFSGEEVCDVQISVIGGRVGG